MNRNSANTERRPSSGQFNDFQSQPALNMPSYGAPSFTTSTTQRVISPFGNFDNLPQYQQHQDAFVQQHLQNQAQYNSGQRAGQNPDRVPIMDAWKQAGDNIASGVYQGNPLATGNMAGLANLFGQYGMTMQPGFQDSLLQMLGQQSPPPLMSAPAQPSFTPKPVNPQTGLPYGQPAPQQAAPPAALPERAPWTPPPPPPGGYRNEQQRRDAEYQSRIQYMMNPGLNQDASIITPPAAPPSPQPYGGYVPRRPGMPYGQPAPQQAPQLDLSQDPGYQQWRGGIRTDTRARTPAENAAREQALMQQWLEYDPYLNQQGPGLAGPQQPAPGYGGAIGLQPIDRLFQDIIDRDGDSIDDRFQPGPGQRPPEWPSDIPDPRPATPRPRPGAAQPIPQRSEGTPYPDPPPPLRAAPGSSGPGWRESEGRRIYDGYTDPRGTGTPGVMGPNHIAPGRRISPITGQVEYDPYTDPIATGGGPATPHNAPIGNTWGTGRPAPPPLRRDPILDPRPSTRPPPRQPRNRTGDLFGF